MLDVLVEEWAARVGRTMACVAFGVNERSNRHRRQGLAGRARPRPPVEPRQRRPHPARLTVELIKWRTGAEGRIAALKRQHGWGRARLRSLEGARTWCGWGVLSHNAIKIAALSN